MTRVKPRAGAYMVKTEAATLDEAVDELLRQERLEGVAKRKKKRDQKRAQRKGHRPVFNPATGTKE